MAELKVIPFELMCTDRGRSYFPTGVRQGVFVTVGNGVGEYSPLPGVTRFGLAEISKELKALAKNGVVECLDGDGIDEMARGIERIPASDACKYVLSLALFHTWVRSITLPPRVSIGLSELLQGTPELCLAQAQEAKARGLRCLKVKVGGGLQEDIDKINRLHDVLGSSIRLRLDGNKRFDFSDAVVLLKSLRHVPIDFFEEPLKDISQSRRLFDACGVALAIDESLTDMAIEDLPHYGISVVVIKPCRFASFFRTLWMAKQSASLGLRVIFSPSFESDFTAALMAVAVWHVGLEHDHHGFFIEGFFKHNVFPEPLRSVRGRLHLEDAVQRLALFNGEVSSWLGHCGR